MTIDETSPDFTESYRIFKEVVIPHRVNAVRLMGGDAEFANQMADSIQDDAVKVRQIAAKEYSDSYQRDAVYNMRIHDLHETLAGAKRDCIKEIKHHDNR